MMTLKHLRLLAQRSVQEFFGDGCTQMAAAISYYVLFSLFPLAIVATAILGLFLRDTDFQESVVDTIIDYVPFSEDKGRQDVLDTVQDVASVSSGTVGAIGLVTMAWSASAMFAVIRRSLNTAFGQSGKRPFLRQKLLDFAMMLALGVFFIASITATAFLRLARQWIDDVPVLAPMADTLGFGWEIVAFLIPVMMSFLAFLFLYWLVPAMHVSPRQVWPGALVAAVLFEAAKVAFSIYLQNFGNYDLVFGSLAAVIIFLFWVFISANVMLFGAEVASEYPKVMRGDYDIPEDIAPIPVRERIWRIARGLMFHEDESRTRS